MSRLRYHATEIDLHLGDHLTYRRLFRRVPGRVCYLPGESQAHPEMEYRGVKRWAIELEDGTVISWLFSPELQEPSSRIRFERRADEDYEPLLATSSLE